MENATIDINRCIEQFNKYVSNFDINIDGIKLKKEHSLRVMKISKEIAEKLNLDEKSIKLATVIGLLHDIARFEQCIKYQTFNDLKSFDHGDYAVEILNKELRNYIDSDVYDEIIKKAIKNHNKFDIEENLNEKELLFTKIIRDADKLDILYECIILFFRDEEKEVEEAEISEVIYNQFLNKKMVKVNKQKYYITDGLIRTLAFIYDINFKPSFEIIKKEDYINRIIDRFNYKNLGTKEKMENIRKIANEYIDKKIEAIN